MKTWTEAATHRSISTDSAPSRSVGLLSRSVEIGAILLFIGANIQGPHLNIVWYIGDIANAFMAFPNLISMIILAGLVGKVTKKYFYKKDNK